MKEGTKVIMTADALENYGDKYNGVVLVITHVAHNQNEHPGYDMGVYPQGLYDLKIQETGEDLHFSLYDWELVRVS